MLTPPTVNVRQPAGAPPSAGSGTPAASSEPNRSCVPSTGPACPATTARVPSSVSAVQLRASRERCGGGPAGAERGVRRAVGEPPQHERVRAGQPGGRDAPHAVDLQPAQLAERRAGGRAEGVQQAVAVEPPVEVAVRVEARHRGPVERRARARGHRPSGEHDVAVRGDRHRLRVRVHAEVRLRDAVAAAEAAGHEIARSVELRDEEAVDGDRGHVLAPAGDVGRAPGTRRHRVGLAERGAHRARERRHRAPRRR